MSQLRNGGECCKCRGFIPAGGEVSWTEVGGRNRFFHSSGCPAPSPVPSSAPTPSPAPSEPRSQYPEPVSVSVERSILSDNGDHILIRMQGRSVEGCLPMSAMLRSTVDAELERWAESTMGFGKASGRRKKGPSSPPSGQESV